MTKQEAKNILVYQLGFICDDLSFEQQQFCKALEIAIEALEDDISIENLAEIADKFDRVNAISPSDLRKALERATLEYKNAQFRRNIKNVAAT